MTETENVMSGELAYLPDLFIMTVGLIPLVLIVSCIILFFSIYFKKWGKSKLYFLSLICPRVVVVESGFCVLNP